MNDEATVARRTTRGRPAGERDTRDALLRTAVRILEDEGDTAISTVRLTRETGIVQSGFYNHFPSLDACLTEAATLVAQQIRGPVRASLHRLRREEIDLGETSGEPARDHFRRVLDLLIPRFGVIATLRDGHDDTPVSRVMRRLYNETIDDVAVYVRTYAAHQDIALADHDPRVDLLAVLLTDLTLGAAQERARNPAVDAGLLATMLSDCARAMVVRIIHGSGPELRWTDPTEG